MAPRRWVSKPTPTLRGGKTCCERSATSCSVVRASLSTSASSSTPDRAARSQSVAVVRHQDVFSSCGGGPNGLAIGPDGFFYLCNNGGSRYVEGHSMGIGPHPDYKFGSVQ